MRPAPDRRPHRRSRRRVPRVGARGAVRRVRRPRDGFPAGSVRAVRARAADRLPRRIAAAALMEARLRETEHGLVPEGAGWYVVNATESPWLSSRGALATFCH